MKIRLQHVNYMPKLLEPGVLYVSLEYGTAAHLCACGCGSKIRTPLGPTEWSLTETASGPTLNPSVGNWQQACQSHYWIIRGEIDWYGKWSPDQIVAGRQQEEYRRQAYYKTLNHKQNGPLQKFWTWIKQNLK